MKRTLSLLLCAAMLLPALCSCRQAPPEPGTEASTQPTAEGTTAPAQAVTQPTVQPQAAPSGKAAPLQITEIMPDNRNLVMGHEYDWVELYNPTDTAVALDGYALTDDPEKPDALPLTGCQIPAEDYLVITLEDTAAFGLSETGETLWLTYRGKTVASLSFGSAQAGASFAADGSACLFPTPGYANTEAGYYACLEAAALPELSISEVMPANGSYYPYNYYLYYDLVEVCNTSGQPLSLKDYYLTDSWDGGDRYFFPDITLAPGEMYVVFCSGDASLGQSHAPFGLVPGETVYLAKKGSYIDALPIPRDLQYNKSYGRSGKVPVYLDSPTPGKVNTNGSLTGIPAPSASVAPGLYDEPVTVTLSGPGTIYYTTSGARPTTYSRVYTEPITVSDIATVRAICVENGRQSPVANFTYAIGKEHDLPVLVISLPESSIWGPAGLHENLEGSYEYEAVMTLFEDGEEKFTVPMGIRLHGNDSRKGAKKNYKLLFKAEYGVSKLNYHLFEDRDIDEFNSLILKGGSEDWGASMMRDEIATAVADGGTELYTQAIKPVVAYIAGTYWGVNYLRERFDEHYVASHMNVSPESVDLLNSVFDAEEAGSSADYAALKRYVRSHDMSTNESYAYLCQQINVTSLIDWYACRTYFGDIDIANIRRFRSTEADGKWHWMFFDMDWSFYTVNYTPIAQTLHMFGGDRELIQAVIASEAGRDAFLKRYAHLLRTVLNEAYVTAEIDALVAAIASEMPRDRDRWNRTMSGWESYVEELRRFSRNRKRVILKDLQNYFYLSDSQMAYYFGDLMD